MKFLIYAIVLFLIIILVVFINHYELLNKENDAVIEIKGDDNDFILLSRNSTNNYYLINQRDTLWSVVIDVKNKKVGSTNIGSFKYIKIWWLHFWYRNEHLFIPIDDPIKGYPEGRYRFFDNKVEIYFKENNNEKSYEIIIEF